MSIEVNSREELVNVVESLLWDGVINIDEYGEIHENLSTIENSAKISAILATN